VVLAVWLLAGIEAVIDAHSMLSSTQRAKIVTHPNLATDDRIEITA
jgi:hypothetical protein